MKFPEEPAPGAPITASWGAAVARCLRALALKPGAGIRVIGPTAEGTTVALEKPLTPRRAASEPGSRRIVALVLERPDELSPYALVARELEVLAIGAEVEFDLPEAMEAVDQVVVEKVEYDPSTRKLTATERSVKVVSKEPTTTPVEVFQASLCPEEE